MTQLSDVMARYSRWKKVGSYNPADLFTRKGHGQSRAVRRKRKNKEPCPQCGATDLVYRWVKHEWVSVTDRKRWFCFCGRTEDDE